MQNPSLNSYADYETKILPTSRLSFQTLCQMWLIRNRQSRRNFSIVTTPGIFDSPSELERSKGCRLSQMSAQNTECFQSGSASLAWFKTPQCNRTTRSTNESEINASGRLNRGRDREAASLRL